MTNISRLAGNAIEDRPVEIVERKGLGHPDTICDAIAEALSQRLCTYYVENFGLILHHNVDKALLWGGTAEARFGGGQVIEPMELFLAGRATCEFSGETVPINDIVHETCEQWLRSNFHALDPARHLKVHSLIRPGSADLVELYLRQQKTGKALANDTSCGVGYAPLSNLESLVIAIEKELNTPAFKTAHPETGEDIKVMAVRHDDRLIFTVACAFVDRYLDGLHAYQVAKETLASYVGELIAKQSPLPAELAINAADDPTAGSVYLTVTGTSGEAGDDGEVGRGNRVNGVINPYRPMNMEAAPGKNPMTHVGKLYNLLARRIAEQLVADMDAISEADCYLVSKIGAPIDQPQTVDIRIRTIDSMPLAPLYEPVNHIVDQQLATINELRAQLLRGEISVY